jgi:guanidinopropionase
MNSDRIELPIDSGSVARFIDVATFMRTPRIDDLSRVDIGLVGVPFDLGLAYRPGARHGPAAVREASRLIRRINPTTGVFPFELCQVADVGDVVTHPLDLLASIDAIAAHFRRLRDHDVRPIAIGGDHSITLPILRGLFDGTPFGIVQIDSHADTLDEFYGMKINHATSFRRATEEGLIDPKRVVQVGLRGSQWGRNDIAFSLDSGMRCITYDEYETLGRGAVIDEIKRVVGDGPTYVSFDVDGLDPVYAPGTAVPEPGGLTMRDAQVVLRSLTGLNILGGDVVEVSPPLDPSGITAVHAANLMFEIMCLVAVATAR